MSSILIRSVEWQGRPTDLFIEGNTIARIAETIDAPGADTVIDGRGKALIPGLINAHTHAAMTLFRGYGDDMPLMQWLEQAIWPNEAKLTHEDVYWGAKLACVEMLRSGTTTFFDMYHKLDATAEAVQEMGLRAVLCEACFDHFRPEEAERSRRHITRRYATPPLYGPRVGYALGPHAIYTVSGELLQWSADFARDHDTLIHLHLAETTVETEQCLARFGQTPVRYLHSLGILSPRLVIAHGLYVDEEEIRILANHGVNNKEHFIRVNGIANVASLRHQCLVNAQTTSSIHDHHIVLGAFCFLNAAARHINRITVGGAHVVVVGVNRSARVRRKAGHSGAFRHNLQLLDSTWSLQVTGHKHGGVPLPGKVLG